MTRRTELESLGRPTFESLEPRWLLAAAYPTAYEQYLVELINRARANPTSEATRYGIALNEGLPSGTISTAAKPPLAINPYLTDAAQTQTDYMFSSATFSHTGSGGSTPLGRMTAAGYNFGTYYSWGESIGALYVTTTTTVATSAMEQLLFVDSGVTNRTDRLNITAPGYTEIGVGVERALFSGKDSVIATEDFAYTKGNPFLTGVIYDDTLVTADNFYTPGEGLGNVQITAVRRSDNANFTTTTWASGGYSLALPAGTYDVVASGGSLGGTMLAQGVTIAAQNVALDFNGHFGAPWTQVASFGGTPSAVTDVDVDPGNSQHILLSTRAGIYQTTDGGGHWTLAQAGMVRQLAFDPTTPSTVYAVLGGDTGGLLKSLDGGSTWNATGLANRDVATLAIASAAPNVLYVGDFSGGAVWRSADGGDTWNSVLNGKGFFNTTSSVYVKTLSASADGKTVYSLMGYQTYDTGYVLKSTTSGATWTAVTTPVNGSITAMAVDPTNAQNVYVGAPTGFYRSSNGGTGWAVANTGLPSGITIRAITVDAQNPFRIYVGAGSAVYRTSNWGDTWQPLGAATTSQTGDLVWSLAVDPSQPLVIYAAVVRSPLLASPGSEEGVYEFTRTAPVGSVIAVSYTGGTITDGQTAAINFGTVKLAAKAPSVVFTIRNNGDEPLLIDSPLPTMDPFTATAPLSTILRPGQSTTFTVTLKTGTAGTFNQTVAITTNDAGASPFTFTITGKVVQPDLTGSFPAGALAVTAIPGDTMKLPFTLTNLGTATASGTIAVALYASTDPTFATSVSLGTATTLAVSLGAGLSANYTVSGVVPGNLAPGQYYIRAVIDSTHVIAESDETNNTVTSTETKTVLWRFGTFDGHTNKSLVLKDSLGHPITFGLTGGGYGDVTSAGPGGFTLELTGTTSASAAAITASYATTLAGVTVNGSLAGFSAAVANLVGNFTVDGTLGSLTLGNVTGSVIAVTNPAPTALAMNLTFKRVTETSLTTNQAIGTLTATDWLTTDPTAETIQAPKIANLAINKVTGATGSFEANLWLTGELGGTVLGKATIAGSLLNSDWDVGGAAGPVTVTGLTDQWDWGADAGSLVTTAIGALVLGKVGTANVVTSGVIGAVSAIYWQHGLIQAARSSTIKTIGATGIAGNFGADLVLTQATLAGATPLLTSFTVAGWLTGASIRSAGPLTTISVGGITGSTVYVGIADGVTGLPTDPADFSIFTNTLGATINGIGTFTVKGIGTTATLFINSYVSTWTMGTVALKGVQVTNTDPALVDEPIGVSGHSIATYTRDKTKLTALVGPRIVQNDTDFYVQLV